MSNDSNSKKLTTYSSEVANIQKAARKDAGLEKRLKYKKGDYLLDGVETPVPHGTKYRAHPEAWTKMWVRFEKDDDGNFKRADQNQKVYRVAKGEQAPEREDLGDMDDTKWAKGPDGKTPSDPWVLFYLLPFESMSDDELVVFSTRTIGGRRAVADLCSAYARHITKNGGGQPIIKLAEDVMPTKRYGKVSRPKFDIVGWDDDAASDLSPVDDMPPDDGGLPPLDDAVDFDDAVQF